MQCKCNSLRVPLLTRKQLTETLYVPIGRGGHPTVSNFLYVLFAQELARREKAMEAMQHDREQEQKALARAREVLSQRETQVAERELVRSLFFSENVHALEGLACRKRVTPASSPAAPASRVWHSRRLCSTLAAAPGLLAHALVTKQ